MKNILKENRYATYQTPTTSSNANPVKFRAEDMASSNINKYVTHYPTTPSTHLQYGYNTNQQQPEAPKTSYVHTTSVPSVPTITTTHTHSELSQDITSLLLKEQSVVSSDSTKRVLQTSSVADYLSHLPTLHHFLKYSAESAAIKKETVVPVGILNKF